MIRVVVADDHPLLREGVRALLAKADDIEVVGEAPDGPTAILLASRLKPDVLVTDLAMPGAGGIAVLEALAREGLPTHVIVLSMHGDDALVGEALAKGAHGYVLKEAVTEELLLAIRTAARGGTYIGSALGRPLLGQVAPEVRPPSGGAAASLTARELQILRLIGAGHTSKVIAAELGLSVKTVEHYRTSLLAKFGASNLVGLIRGALREGLLDLGEDGWGR
ncbi:MAG TPA: response regulator transcription factor [Anaerolineae bacterium]|jgi:DNA-binding NarL/FixJ family response regulator|nr:response regulator transcription factor [Anaerolineae bacterium]HRA19324.1 response regulator transcription factor [Anaerolineae bacterium]